MNKHEDLIAELIRFAESEEAFHQGPCLLPRKAAATIETLEADKAMLFSSMTWATDEHVKAELAKNWAIKRAEAAEAELKHANRALAQTTSHLTAESKRADVAEAGTRARKEQ
tara:strand:- start:11568 stop:11906 length:339 start_codon:yes stop_codon:yes gene_type:complete